MTSKKTNKHLSDCGCCQSIADSPRVYNPPGLKEVSYRLGSHPVFFRNMIERIPRQQIPDGVHKGTKPLFSLTTRDKDDPAIALLDAWASVSEVLCFYQERYFQEGFLSTATERFSVLQLARMISYELSPGVSAGVYLAFKVDESDKTPDTAIVSKGTQIQSIPAKEDELPQTFETKEDFEAKVRWNEIRARTSEPQSITFDSDSIYLEGLQLNLSSGDQVLLLGKTKDGIFEPRRKRIARIEENADHQSTHVIFEQEAGNTFNAQSVIANSGFSSQPQDNGINKTFSQAFSIEVANPGSFNSGAVFTSVLGTVSELQLQNTLSWNNWSTKEILDLSDNKKAPVNLTDIEVYVFRENASIFGHNAMLFKQMPTDPAPSGIYHDWDSGSGFQIWKDSVIHPDLGINATTFQTKTLSTAHRTSSKFTLIEKTVVVSLADDYSKQNIYLDHPVDKIEDDSWILLEDQDKVSFYRILSSNKTSVAGFGLSAKTTGLTLTGPNGESPEKDSSFKVRSTQAYLKPEKMNLATIPIDTPVPEVGASQDIHLDRLVLELSAGQALSLSGELADGEGVIRSEVQIIDSVNHVNGLYTQIKLTAPLENTFKRDTVVINANLVWATHGESVSGEVIGHGDGAQSNASYYLKKSPLTFTSAATPSGRESSLTLFINDVKWEETPSLYKLASTDRKYILRLNDDGESRVVFGDGKSGARVPTGQENIVANYRQGIGGEGEVGRGSLTLMKKRPFGVKSVTNPLDASGAEDPETLVDARMNAPLTVLTLDRIVSRQDFEDFARAFAGVGKAQAIALWKGEQEWIHLSLASSQGDEILETSDLYINLKNAIDKARDPLRPVSLASFRQRFFALKARIKIDPAFIREKVEDEIRNLLTTEFSFKERGFGQTATSAEVMEMIHRVNGVIATDLDHFHRLDDSGNPEGNILNSVLPSDTARPLVQADGKVLFLPAELLLIHPFGITLTDMPDQ